MKLHSHNNIQEMKNSKRNIANRTQRLGHNLNEESTSLASEIIPTDGDTGNNKPFKIGDTEIYTSALSPSYSVEIIKDLNKTS